MGQFNKTINEYAHDASVSNLQKQTLLSLKGKINSNAIIEGNFNILHLSIKDQLKKMSELNYIVDPVNLTNIYRTFHQQL